MWCIVVICIDDVVRLITCQLVCTHVVEFLIRSGKILAHPWTNK